MTDEEKLLEQMLKLEKRIEYLEEEFTKQHNTLAKLYSDIGGAVFKAYEKLVVE